MHSAMLLLACLLAGTASATFAQAPTAETRYFPPPGPSKTWERRSPQQVGLNADRLEAAVKLARKNEMPWRRELGEQIFHDSISEPAAAVPLGPTIDRGGPSGVVLRHGYVLAEWGDADRVEMAFSITKSYLSTVAGLAVEQGRILDLRDRVVTYVTENFDSRRNSRVTWQQLLQQTSEWQGDLWSKPDAADRRAGRDRSLQEPGTFWEYNDVRVNALAFALTKVWQRPLPEVLKQYVMDPIGASGTWQWHGYRNSIVNIEGRAVASVSGGGHWGGGLWASVWDHARYGYLFLRRGEWAGKQVVSETWIKQALAPSALMPTYGYLWWLNTNQQLYPAASAASFFAQGSGGNVIWIDPANDLVVVARWLRPERFDEFFGAVTAAVER
ncbi:MAG TPA: serine hydrolase [Burkholderiales bacterium]|nr:serine hydrolase [Burkholderiales bacterium]